MPGKRYSVEQIVAKLREAERLQGQGMTVPQTCKKLGVSDQTFYRWRTKYGALKEDEAQRLKALEQENSRLKRIVAEQALDISMLKDLQSGKMVSPARRRDAVKYLCRRHKVSERRACQLVGQHRSTQRYAPIPTDYETRLIAEMHALATEHPRFGYRMVHALLVDRGWAVNRKRIERLWRLEGLKVPPARKKRWGNDATGVDANSAWALPSLAPGHVWSYDFVAARTRDGGPLRILNVVDEFTRECVGAHVARNIGTREVRRFLERLFAERGRPELIRSDNGREFSSAELVTWLAEQGVTAAFIAKASPQQNCFVERFNGTMRDQLLNGEEFDSVLEAKVVIGDWVELYNTVRPHRALKMRTPERFAADWHQANPGHRRRRSPSTASTAIANRGKVKPMSARGGSSKSSR